MPSSHLILCCPLSFSVILCHPLLLLLQSFPASGSFQMSQFFSSGGQPIGASASASVLPMNIQDWSPTGWTGWISLQSKGLSRVSNITVQKHQFYVQIPIDIYPTESESSQINSLQNSVDDKKLYISWTITCRVLMASPFLHHSSIYLKRADTSLSHRLRSMVLGSQASSRSSSLSSTLFPPSRFWKFGSSCLSYFFLQRLQDQLPQFWLLELLRHILTFWFFPLFAVIGREYCGWFSNTYSCTLLMQSKLENWGQIKLWEWLF